MPNEGNWVIQYPRKVGGPKAASHKPTAPGVHCAPQGPFLYLLPLWVATTLGWIVFTTLSASHIHFFSVICVKQKLLPLCDKEKPGPRKWHTQSHLDLHANQPLYSPVPSLCPWVTVPFTFPNRENKWLFNHSLDLRETKIKPSVSFISKSINHWFIACLVGTQVGVHRSTGYYVSAKTKLMPMNYNMSYY